MSRSVTKLKFLDITKNQRVPEKDENIPEKIRVHTEHLREIGRDMLKLRVDEKADMEKEQAEIREQQAAVGKLLRRRIKVSDMQDGGASISMDQEWDTSGWSTEMIEGGCQAILLLFQETGANSDLRKQRALQMLDKLIYRHDQAHKYVKHSLESIINKTCNRKVRGGRGASFVDLLHVCHSLKVKFVDEQSHHNFCGKFYDMCLVESKLACILIQHTFRKFRDNSRRRPMEGLIAGFGSEAEINMLRKRAVNARSSEIRAIWRLMHAHMSESQRNQPGGIRGPCTISQEHVFLGLQTTLHLVSDKATRYATSNREDVVYSHGIISLSTYLGCASGPFAEIASDILCWVSKCPESLMPLLSSGVIQSAYRFMDFLLEGLKDSHRERIESSNSGLITEGSPKKHRHGNASPTAAHSLTRNHDDNYNDNQHQHHYQHHAYLRKNLSDKTKSLYTNCIRLICRCAIHAAGVFRARAGYPCVKSRLLSDDVEEIDYEYVLRAFENKIPPKLIIQQLGDVKMIVELMKMMLNTDNDGILIDTLQALFALAATDCYMELLEQVIAHSGLCFHYIVNLMLREDEVVSTLAMTILLQLCTRANGRNALIHTNAEYHIAPLIPTVDHQYKRVPYCRSMLIVAALIRQHEWQPYEPEYFVETAMTEPQMRRLLFLDLMKTIKIVDFEDSETFDSITLQELVLLPFTDDSTLEQMSKQARVINAARQLSDFLCHPGELSFFESMPWEESAATCQILQALSQSPETSLELFSEGLVNFLGQCLYVSKHAFIGKSIVGMNIQVVLAAVTAASITISHLCKSGNHHTRHALIIINGIKHSNLIGAAAFFIPGLSAANKKLTDKELRFRQESAGFAAVVLMDSYTAMLLTLDEVKMKQLQMGTEEKELSDGHGLLDSSSKPKPTAVGKKRKKKPVPVNRDQPISADHIIARLMAEVEPVGIQITNLIAVIKGVYGVSEQTYHLLDMFCNLLEKITTPVPTAATAILKWKTYEALAKHLPPPLAAVGTVAMVSNSTMKRNSSQSMEQLFPSLANSGGGGGIGTGGVFASSDPAAGHSPDSMVKTASGGFGGVDHRYSSPTNPTGDHMMASDVSGMAGMFHTSSAPGTATDTFNNSNTNNSRQMTRQQQSQQQQQILYARTLGALPSSFFYVISNLCQSLQGVSKAFGDGYLRRALEKCVIAYEDLELASVFDEDYIREHEHAVLVAKLGVGAVAEDEETHQHGHSRMTNNGYVFDQEHHEDLEQERIERGKAQLGKYSSANTIDKAREDITAVLRILNRCANYNNSKLGSSNELIFLPQYGVIEMCCSILSSSTCPRNDPVFTTAMTCICTFSKDGYRVVDQFIAGSMPQIILEELSRTKEGDNSNCLEIKHLVECLEIIRNFTITMSTEEAVTSFFPLYREHVMRVVRLYPEKALFGNDVLWNMAKIGMSKHKGLSDGSGSVGSGGMEQLQKEINELARSTVDFDDPACFTPAKGTLKTGSMALVRSSIEYSKEAIASVGLSSPLNSGSSPNKSGDRPGCFSPHRAGSFLGSRSMIVNTTGSNVSAEDIASGAIKGAELVRRAKERKALKKKSSIAVDDEQVTVISYTEEELREGVEKTPGTYLAVGVTTNGGLKATTDHHNI